jgi:hypothetical protein
MKVSGNDDLICATTDWLYMTYRRLGKDGEANAALERIHDQMNIIENDSYFKRLMMYKGKIAPSALLSVDENSDDPALTIATQGYGVANWYLCNGDSVKAKNLLTEILKGKHFSAFGFIAAENDLGRLNNKTP